MAKGLRKFKATSAVLGLGLVAVMAGNFGCSGGAESKPAGSAVVGGCGCGGAKDDLAPDEQAIVDKLRASGIKVMSAAELKKELASEKPPVVVDVLPSEKYAEAHVKGSISLPLDQIQAAAAQQLPDPSARIVVYCASFHCGASTEAATELQKMGYKDVLDFKGGMKQWRELNLPIEGIEAPK